MQQKFKSKEIVHPKTAMYEKMIYFTNVLLCFANQRQDRMKVKGVVLWLRTRNSVHS